MSAFEIENNNDVFKAEQKNIFSTNPTAIDDIFFRFSKQAFQNNIQGVN